MRNASEMLKIKRCVICTLKRICTAVHVTDYFQEGNEIIERN